MLCGTYSYVLGFVLVRIVLFCMIRCRYQSIGVKHMKVIKTYRKQIELAEKGLLFCLVNCAYLRVSAEHVRIAKETGQNVKFYAKA